jgi:hypothetical protein
VRLLVCQNCQDDHFPNRTEVISWCIENQFELVELDDDDDVDDDDEEESEIGKPFGSGEFGVPRIVAALQAHMWSNMELIPNQVQAAGGLNNTGSSFQLKPDADVKDSAQEVESNDTVVDSSDTEEEHLKEMFNNMNLLSCANPNGDSEDEESFEQLFNKMAHLKSKLSDS